LKKEEKERGYGLPEKECKRSAVPKLKTSIDPVKEKNERERNFQSLMAGYTASKEKRAGEGVETTGGSTNIYRGSPGGELNCVEKLRCSESHYWQTKRKGAP